MCWARGTRKHRMQKNRESVDEKRYTRQLIQYQITQIKPKSMIC